MGKLDGKVAFVTGASSGIGKACASALAREGATVILGGRTLKPMVDVASDITEAGGRAFPRVMDVREEKHIQAAVDFAARELGGLHIMVNSAGVNHFDNILEGDVANWREMFDVNVIAMMIGCREAVRVMKGQGSGHIVNVSSVDALGVNPENPVYGATKYAVNAITEGLRRALVGQQIRVTNIMPGGVLTSMARNMPPEQLMALGRGFGIDPEAAGLQPGQHLPPEVLERAGAATASVLLKPEDVAEALLFAVCQPPTVHVNELVVRPSRQLPFLTP
jgi:NADP-dependent 3-hydroxy acid dehydrogenase YdfG